MNKGYNYIILNWMLPAIPSFPSPAMSVLKSQLQEKGYDVKVIYWCFFLEPLIRHYWGKTTDNYQDHLIYYLSPIYAYLAIEYNDEISISQLNDYWNKVNKESPKSRKMFLEHLNDNISLFRNIIKEIAIKYQFNKCLFIGFYQKLFQMYGAEIVSRELKAIYPDTQILLGGIDTKDEAIAAMDNFSVFDYALWGEGEYTILSFADFMKGNICSDLVKSLVFRIENQLYTTNRNREYTDLNASVTPDFTDYFEQSTIDESKIRLPIEGSRGCHWSKCKFCFHNEGIRYRRKSPKRIIEEIRMQIEKYHIYQFSFLDNDTIGKNIVQFQNLLDQLITLKKDYPQFYISRAEIVTRNLNGDIVEKMQQAGFRDVQIGYESLSDDLLIAIQKCNTFSSNFLFIKWALLSGIKIRGANLIMNLLEETESNLRASYDTLRFLRFMLDENRFMHIYSTLWIKKSSRYFKTLEEKGHLEDWKIFKSFRFIPKQYIKEKNMYTLQFFVNPQYHPIWDEIENKEWEYFKNIHTYKIKIQHNNHLYEEFNNNKLINSIILNDIDWDILCSANRKVISFEEIAVNSTKENIKNRLRTLKHNGIIYYYKNYLNIVTVINTDCPLNKFQRYT